MGDFFKRVFDIVFTTISLIILSPFLLVFAILVRTKLGSPVFFRQQRPGKNGRIFTLVKFRTMKDARRPDGTLLPDEERMTKFGSFLRSASIDELPELWNVLKGDMSMVGPRPLMTEYLERYSLEQARRHNVKPGITGWAQVNGRNDVTWEKRFEDDVWYVDHRSFWLDLKIIVKTFAKVFKREGISQEGHVTMPPFMGSQAKARPDQSPS